MYLISELAKKCGVNKETIRYYERKGLLNEPSRTNAGYRVYSEESADRIKFIKRMQDLGFTLSEIIKLLGIVDKDAERCKDMNDFVSNKIDEVQMKIKDLMRIEKMLIHLREKCPTDKSMYECPIIETLVSKNEL
ncbi:Hg(II)-responsive transcriptional regulator [Bacillus massiliigorillae]|uniref:Hg(II)-responsive transcriptional regulator n=1 Tax=Bacillus massiliigorillae TaxID=1243664 RepID=UPI0003A2C48C|nr:Hg(II)-responsive transcriptional regulator [Bacillus massiliigorillae]